jgi:hypothetical protein
MSFAGRTNGFFGDIFINVTNVYREELEKYQVSSPDATPPSMRFSAPITITLSSATVGTPKIYYTLDGSNPTPASAPYNNPIPIDTTTTIKALAVMPGDTQWVNSEIATATYTYDVSSIRGIQPAYASNVMPQNAKIYNIRGQEISSLNLHSRDMSSVNGVVIVCYGNGSGDRFVRHIVQ